MFDFHDALSLSVVKAVERASRSVCRSHCRSRKNIYHSLWHYISYRDTNFAADPRVYDVPFVGSAVDEWTIVQQGCPFGFAFDASEPSDVPAYLHPDGILSGRTWSQS